MAKIQFCPLCKESVQPKKVNKLIFLILLCCGFFPGIIYWIVCGGNKCPRCNYKF